MSGTENINNSNDIKLIEARTAILLQNGDHASRNDSTMWILEHMFRPLIARDYNGYELLLLSGNTKPAWERKKQPQTDSGYFVLQNQLSPSINEQTPPFISSTIKNAQSTADRMYMITPRTRILTVSKEQNIVFMIDLSSSLATIETSTGKVMIGNTLSVLENIIQGLVKPFSLNMSENSSPINIEYTIRITVIAECSQFGSNMNVIPILAEYPTMRVLLQNVQVSTNNVNAVLNTLQELIDTFKSDLGKFRKDLKEKRKLGYELDVRDDHSQSVTESGDSNFNIKLTPSDSSSKSTQARKGSISLKSTRPQQQSKQQPKGHSRNKSISKQQNKKSDTNLNNNVSKKSSNSTSNHHHHHPHHHHRHTSLANNAENGPTRRTTTKDKKDVWGVGKTGSSLSYILRSALFALNLLPKKGQHSIILLTDGVVKSNIQDESIISQLTAENVSCNVIQIGHDKSFFPGLNFGFVPDNEILEFMSTATYGVFSYADQCPPVTTDDTHAALDIMPPNIYHHRYMLKEIFLDRILSSRLLKKQKESNNAQNNSMDNVVVSEVNPGASSSHNSGSVTHLQRRAFPWDPISKPITEDWVRLNYKEYFLPTECSHFMKARLRQGFVLQSVSLFDDTKANGSRLSGNTINKQGSDDNLSNFQQKQNVVIIFILRWQPDVTVQYSIKALWTSSLRHHLFDISTNQDKLVYIPEDPKVLDNENIFSRMRSPKAEITIKATSSFSHSLIKSDELQKRSQIMAVQGGSAVVDLAGFPGFVKVRKMRRFLEKLSETDAMLKQLVQFNISDKSQYSNQQATMFDSLSNIDASNRLNYIQKFNSHWAKVERSELRLFNRCWYDEAYFNLIIGESSSLSLLQNFAEYHEETISKQKKILMIDNNDFDDIQIALNQIYLKLEKWATFLSEDQQVYIKIINISQVSSLAVPHPMENTSLKKFNGTLSSQSGTKRHIVPQFCEVRIIKEADRVVCVKLMFFNTDDKHRQFVQEELQNLLKTNSSHEQSQTLASLEVKNNSFTDRRYNFEEDLHMASNSTITVSKRPLSSLLMRDSAHYLAPTMTMYDEPLKVNTNNTSNQKAAWYINTALVLTGEFIVRNYLNQYTWHWDAQDPQGESFAYRRYFLPIMNLAFEHIVVVRLEQKWNLISSNKSFAHFYKEVSDDADTVYSVQYFVWKDIQKHRVTTELWLEPISDDTTFKMLDTVRSEIFETDKQIFSQLLTFDIIYNFGQNTWASVADALTNPMEHFVEVGGITKWMQKPSLFNLPSVLKSGSFLYALYPCPNYNRHFHPEGNDSVVFDQHQQQQLHQQQQNNMIVNEISDANSNNGRRRTGVNNNSGTIASGSRSRTVSKFSPIGSPHNPRTPIVWHSDKCSTCTCPRPDELFSKQKEEISKLRPVYRDIALLHYYVEQSLTSVTDRSISVGKLSNDDFWSTIIKELLKKPEICGNKSTLNVAQNFRDLRYFVKIFDPAIFIVLLFPKLQSVVKGLCKMDNAALKSNEDCSYDHMGLMMFECQRQDTVSSYGNSLKINQINVHPVDPLASKEWLESLRSTLRPTLSRGYFSSYHTHTPLSDRTLRLMQDITKVYSRSFVKSIFTCLLHGRAVDSEDFEKVLDICDESNLDIDLTGYLNVQTLLKKRSRTSEEELILANQKFISVLGHYFEPVIISNSKWSNMYCYRPPFAKVGQKLGLSLASGEKPSNLADVVVCAQNPLFIRLDCTLRKPSKSGIGYTEVTFPLKNLLVSYEGKLEDGTAYNYEPESIGTRYSPVDSADGTTATLHLVCMTLPQSEYDPPNALFSHNPSCPADSTVHHQPSFLDVDKTHRARLPSLSQDKQDALVETEARLTWLFTEEIMHGLLRSGPITQNVIRYIEAQLKKKNPFVDFPTTMFIPLSFVKSQKESRRMFFQELEKHNSTPYRLVRVGDCFYASDNGTITALDNQHDYLDENESDFDGAGLNITTEPQTIKQQGNEEDGSEQGNDEFCQGLGISILETEAMDEDDDAGTVKQEPVRPQLYWLLLIPQAQSVQIYFYSKMQQSVNRSEIIRVTKSMVNEVMERTNKMSLLQYLHEERRCSKYLLASVEEDKGMYSSCEESSEEEEYITTGQNNNLVEILSTSGEEATFSPPKKFLPGQFSCDIVYTKRFPLHWRIAPNAAYNKLMSDALSPFLVKNKPGMFVCSHEDAVVYCFLSEVSTPNQNNILSDSMNQSFLSANNNGDDGYYMANPESPYGTSLINTNDSDTLSASHPRIRHPVYSQNRPSPQSSITSDRQQFSPRQSPSFTDAGVSATSPIPGRKYGSRYHEGRELVLEVYGVEVDYYIIDGLVDMIESRITSEITLKEVQQFLVRNPNSKLSRADIDFILPVLNEPLVHKQLCIPSFIGNTVQFLKILRKNILSGPSMYAVQSNYLPTVIKQNHDYRYNDYDFDHSKPLEDNDHRAPTDEWSASELSFYYNYLNRAPGTFLPFEQKIGEGVGGVCLSLLNADNIAYSKIGSSNTYDEHENFDINILQSCLDSNFEEIDETSELKLAVDIWSYCKIDTDQLYMHIAKSFRQSICDYIIENIVSTISTTKRSHSSFKTIANLLIFTLKKAISWESSTVRQSSHPIHLAPWYFDGITLQIRSDLTDIHPSLDPVIARAVLSSNIFDDMKEDIIDEEYKLYMPGLSAKDVINEGATTNDHIFKKLSVNSNLSKPICLKKKTKHSEGNEMKQKVTEVPIFDNKNYRYLVVSGLPELLNKFGIHSRRSSSELGASLHGNRSRYGISTHISPINENEPHLNHSKSDNIKRDDSTSLHSRQESLASSISKTLSTYISKQKQNDMKEAPHQRSFLVFQLDSSQLTIFSYNCSDGFADHVCNATFRSVIQQETRHLGLNNILNQKLGLFHHSKTMAEILAGTSETEQHTNSPSINMPLQHSALTQIQNVNTNTRSPMSPNLANTIGRLAQIDSTSSVPSVDSSNGDRRTSTRNNQIIVDFETLQHLVTNNFDFKHRQNKGIFSDKTYQSTSVLDVCTNAKLCKVATTDNLFTSIRGADANTVLKDIFAESIEDNENRYDEDYLLRHGEPYLEMYLSRSKILTAHEKAFKVYAKWADEYYGPGHSTTIDEMMTVDELKQILKASRLLHFCRTPLIFSGSNLPASSEVSSSLIGGGYEKLFNKSIVSRSEDMTAWYERLSRGFMREYASYLESIGMHLIVYGPSNDHPDEIEAYLSKFTITEDYSVDSPIVYLLQVFEGGSIMCEVRLTGAFVSVTLYTLHRRYGRLQNSPFSVRRRNENTGRKNFQDFMGECDHFKQRIHVNSFVFDFHLRYIQRSLDDVDLLPAHLNLLSIIKNTVAVYDRPAIYSRNRIINGVYEYSVDESLGALSSWILNNGGNLGLKTLCVDKVPVACFVSSDNLSFEHNSYEFSAESSSFRYTLIICPAEKSNNHLWRDSISVHRQGSFDMMGSNSAQKIVNRLTTTGPEEGYSQVISFQYYILVTYRGMDRCTSSDNCQKAWSRVLKDKPKRYANFLDEVLVPETFKMNDVFEAAKTKINGVINKAVHYFNREADWNKLYEIVCPNLSKETPDALVKLATRFCPIDLGETDLSFRKFLQLKGINWNDAVDSLKSFYIVTSGEVYVRDTRHVLLFIPNAIKPAFFHFILTPGEKCIVTINAKEDRKEPNVLSTDEKSHISNLATNISYYIWKRLQYTK